MNYFGLLMCKLFLFLTFFLSTLSSANESNISFGTYGNDTGYKYESGSRDMGRLIIFTCPIYIQCDDPHPIFALTPYFFIRINGTQLAEIYGKDYFDITLPIGLYKVEVIKHNDFGQDTIAMTYDVLIKRNRSITIYTRNNENDSYTSTILADPNKLIDDSFFGMKWRKAQIDEQALSNLSSAYINNVQNVIVKEEEAGTYNLKTYVQNAQKSQKEYEDSVNRAAEANEKEAQKLRSARQAEIKLENDKKNAEIQKRENNEMLLAKRNSEEQKEQSKSDDTTCKSYGAKFGSAVYVQCRTQLASQRKENTDRQNTIEVLEKKIDALQTQLNTQQKPVTSNISITSQNRNNELALQQEQLAIQQEQLKVLKAQNERSRAEAALRYIQQQNNPATWGNPTNVRIVP